MIFKVLTNLWSKYFLAATKQLYEWFRLSVCHTFFTMFLSSYHHEILGVITIDKSDVHAKGQGHRGQHPT